MAGPDLGLPSDAMGEAYMRLNPRVAEVLA